MQRQRKSSEKDVCFFLYFCIRCLNLADVMTMLLSPRLKRAHSNQRDRTCDKNNRTAAVQQQQGNAGQMPSDSESEEEKPAKPTLNMFAGVRLQMLPVLMCSGKVLRLGGDHVIHCC